MIVYYSVAAKWHQKWIFDHGRHLDIWPFDVKPNRFIVVPKCT